MHQQTLLPSQQASRPGLAVCPRQRPARPCTRTRAAGRSDSSDSSEGSGPSTSFSDPEAKFRRYGRYFGGGFRLDLDTWFQVPRVRIRQTAQRQKDELLELAVLNERLAGTMAPWQARNRLEQLRMRRRNWEAIYDYVTRTDAAATLALIEEANKKAEQLLSEEESERASVTDLRERLTDLQTQVDEASQRLNMTQKRVEHNLQRVNELKAEAAALERLKETVTAEPVYASSSSSAAPAARATSTVNSRASSTTTTSRASSSSNSSSSMATLTAPPAPVAARQQTGQPSEQQRQQEQQQQRRRSMADRRRDRGLSSSLEIEEGLREFWYPAEFSSRLKTDVMVPFELLEQPWVLFRDEQGRPACVRDECAHRACPLSLGKVIDGKVSCAYHGWEFNGAGECTKMPSTMQCSHIGVAALPCAEKDGFVWVWPGLGAPPEVPSSLAAPEGFEVHSEIVIDVPVEHGLLMENLLDLAHAPFTHTTTFARGWPIPDVVKFHAQQLLSGSWDPYPIDMAFQPPCSVLSRVGLAQPGKIMRGVRADACERHLHQLHVCAPAKKGHTRLLYRMSLDFMPWAKHVPFVDKLWRKVADQVLGEDLVLVLGQQDRLSRGGDTWANPVSYDKLAVRYRRWRNAVAAEGRGSGPQAADALVSMSAGELFAPTESMDGQGECWTGDESDAEQECSVDGPSPLQEARQLVVAAAAGAGGSPSAAVETA